MLIIYLVFLHVNECEPYCEEELKLKVGHLFDTSEDGEKFYKNYMYNVEFSVRSSTGNKNKDGVTRCKYFVCSKEGYKSNKANEMEQGESTTKTRKRSVTREGCNAKVVLLEGGKYELT